MLRDFLKKRLSTVATHHYRKSFAKDQLDKRLEPFLGYKNGFFIEAGANDGLRQSNTFYYETYFNWTGLLIEPVPALARAAVGNRPASTVHPYALGSEGGGKKITLTPAGLMSITEGAFQDCADGYGIEAHVERASKHGCEVSDPITVSSYTLSEIIDMSGVDRPIDFLSLDVEGYEKEALKGLDLARHRPRFILIEERIPGIFADLLGDHYRKVAILAFSDHYVDSLYERIGPPSGTPG